MGSYVEIPTPSGKTFTAYLAQPQSATSSPGLVLCQEIFGVNAYMRDLADLYAAEGYLVLVPDLFWRLQPGIELTDDEKDFGRAIALLERFDVQAGVADIALAVDALRAHPGCTGKVGVVGFCLGGKLAYLAAAQIPVDVAVGYYGVGIEESLGRAASISCPIALHFAGDDPFCPPPTRELIFSALNGRDNVRLYAYPGQDHAFARTGSRHYDKSATMLAHERTITLLRSVLGPTFDLSALWDEHTRHEFDTRDVEATMRTMVEQPYVNHIPTMTGGTGQNQLARFYKHHFIPTTPPDTKLVPISRTIGASQIVDEQLFCFTHTVEIDWMLPGIKPTNKYVEIPLVAIVKFRGGKLCHEHIYWDQASVLVQIGLLDPQGLPVAGRDTALKLLDENRPSNELMGRWHLSSQLTLEDSSLLPSG